MNFNNILFIDIETVSQFRTFDELPGPWKELWADKASKREIRNPELDTAESVYPRASIYAEFGKVICISCGCFQGEGEDRKLVLRSFYNDDEKLLLEEFAEAVRKWERNKLGQVDMLRSLCAHNGKEFDFPYLCRRMIINGVALPESLKIGGKKPWELKHLIDTMEMWKFGDMKSYTTLKLLAAVFGVPSPKDDIDGSKVYSVYWEDRNLERIVEYCQKDVVTLSQVYLRFFCEPLIKPENISIKYVRQKEC
ncbi:MAG TPA: ribonuclease H-like domain-containing protein [Flavisolibacter sp.]|nr:ribonuclease H-like domain-containing protein [Flavisolibacter sp.]